MSAALDERAESYLHQQGWVLLKNGWKYKPDSRLLPVSTHRAITIHERILVWKRHYEGNRP